MEGRVFVVLCCVPCSMVCSHVWCLRELSVANDISKYKLTQTECSAGGESRGKARSNACPLIDIKAFKRIVMVDRCGCDAMHAPLHACTRARGSAPTCCVCLVLHAPARLVGAARRSFAHTNDCIMGVSWSQGRTTNLLQPYATRCIALHVGCRFELINSQS